MKNPFKQANLLQERKIKVGDVTKASYRIELAVAHSHLFWLHVKNDLTVGRLYAACQHICRKDDDPLCRFMVRYVHVSLLLHILL